MTTRIIALRLFVVASLLAMLASCSEDPDGGADCAPDEEFNPIQGVCEPRLRGSDDIGGSDIGGDSGGEDAGGEDTESDSGLADTGDSGSEDSGGIDAVDDTGNNDSGGCPDEDGDGYLAERCGGQDCNDASAAVNPGQAELCDTLDNDCSGQINDGESCTFYAQTSSDLYLVDPFQKTATSVTSVPSLFDMDTHPDGTLYGITSSTLYEFDEVNDRWNQVGSLGTPITTNPNGLAIDTRGTAYMTASNEVFTVDLSTGTATSIGSMGGGFNSSGDCVINKDDTLFMSSNHTSTDSLILIDTNDTSGREIGLTGYSQIYGLTAAWGKMYGLTGSGQLIEIDSGNGQATLVHTFPGKSWYGAASTPNR